jgi:hypothetical protein
MPSVPCTTSGVSALGRIFCVQIRLDFAPIDCAGEHVVLLFDRQHAGAHDARIDGDADDADRQQVLIKSRPQHSDDGNRQDQAGKGEQDVHQPHEQVVGVAADVGRRWRR